MAYKNIDDYKEKTTKFSTDNRCTGCMICKNSCPRRNIEIIDNKPAFGGKCVLCTRCINICPENAILYDGVMRKQYKGLNSKKRQDLHRKLRYNIGKGKGREVA
jgi:Pyruvate/2-oxoacid:ferredoxin oxidoreductase delta subunit